MNDNKFDFSVESLIEEMGIEEKYAQRVVKKNNDEEKIQISDFEGMSVIGGISEVSMQDNEYLKTSKKLKKESSMLKSKANIIFIIMLLSFYLSFATVENLPLPTFLKLIDYPYIFMLANVILHIFALILSVDVISDGLHNVLKPNINTLVSFSSIFILAHNLSVIFISNSLVFLPFTPVAILVLWNSISCIRHTKRSNSYTFRICSMISGLAFITTGESKKHRFAIKKQTQDISNFASKIKDYNSHTLMRIYFVLFLVFSIGFSYYISQGYMSMFFWSLAAISAVSVPINYIVAWPVAYKYASKRLFDDGIAIKSYHDIKKMNKNTSITMSDVDLFPEYAITIDAMTLYGSYSADEVITYVASGFTYLNSCTKGVFERELKNRYLRPLKCKKMDFIEEDGFTFTANNRNISIGNAKFVTSLGITVTDGFNVPNPIYVIIGSRVVSIISIKHTATHKMYNAISKLEQNSIKLVVSTLDFTINQNLIARVYDLPNSSIIFNDFLTRYNNIFDEKHYSEDILISRQSGRSYINAFLSAKRLAWSTKLNTLIGFFCAFLGIIIVSYLLYVFSPTVLFPHNLVFYLFFWSIPTSIISFLYNKI